MNKLKIILLAFGLLILVFLLDKIGFSIIVDRIRSMGWYFWLLVFFPIFFREILFAIAWQYSVNGEVPGFGKVFFAHIAGEAVNYITPGTLIAGEPCKAYLLRHHSGIHSSAASVIISRTTKAIGMIAFVVAGLFMSIIFYEMSFAVKTSLVLVMGLISTGVFIFIYIQKVGISSTIIKWLNKIKLPKVLSGKLSTFIEEKGHHFEELDQQLILFYRHEMGRFYLSLIASTIGWAICALEIYLFMKFLGAPVSYTTAMVIESLSLVINTCFLFMPAGVGTQEAGKVFIFKVLGLMADTGLALGLLRRLREIVWTFFGLAIFAFYKTAQPVKGEA